jgi:hypothetical protein
MYRLDYEHKSSKSSQQKPQNSANCDGAVGSFCLTVF